MSNAKTNRLPGFIRNDASRKLFALLLACLLTVFAYTNRPKQEYENNYVTVPLSCTIDAHETDLFLDSMNIPDLNFTVKTPKKLKKYEMESFYYPYVLTRGDYENGGKIAIKPELLKSKMLKDGTFQVENASPEQVVLDLDIRVKQDAVPVKLMYETSELVDGYVLAEEPALMPNQSVSVSGPKKLVDNLEEIRTKLIPLANANDSFQYRAVLENPYPGKVSVNPDAVDVKVKLKKLEGERFEHVPVQILTPFDSKSRLIVTKITPSEVDIFSNRGDADKLTKEMLHPYVDIRQYTQPGVYETNIKCWCDLNNIQIRSWSPNKVIITLEAPKEVK